MVQENCAGALVLYTARGGCTCQISNRLNHIDLLQLKIQLQNIIRCIVPYGDLTSELATSKHASQMAHHENLVLILGKRRQNSVIYTDSPPMRPNLVRDIFSSLLGIDINLKLDTGKVIV